MPNDNQNPNCDLCENPAEYHLCQEHMNELVVGELSAMDTMKQILALVHDAGFIGGIASSDKQPKELLTEVYAMIAHCVAVNQIDIGRAKQLIK